MYEFLGVADKLGVNFRPGKHQLAKDDWTAVLDFADQQLRGMKVERRFDGFPPDRRQRLIRFFGACVSRLTVVGLLWGLADEENLSWQDHMSRTFPTPDDAESAIIRRG